jgi:hypothetical protein
LEFVRSLLPSPIAENGDTLGEKEEVVDSPCPDIGTWQELMEATRQCPFCKAILWLKEAGDHLTSRHPTNYGERRFVGFEYEEIDPEATYNRVLVCPYCNNVMTEALYGDVISGAARHISETCAKAPRKHAPLQFRVILDQESIRSLLLSAKSTQGQVFYHCSENDDAFGKGRDLVAHFVEKHFILPTKDMLINADAISILSNEIQWCVARLRQAEP